MIAASTGPVTPVEEIPLDKASNGVLPVISSTEYGDVTGQKSEESTVSITVVGASGDLAKKKIFPALFALYYEDCLPKVWLIKLIVCFNFFFFTSWNCFTLHV